MQNKLLQNKIEDTLSSLDKVEKAAPAPFFYTRLMARLSGSKQDSWQRFSTFISRPKAVIAGMMLIILINIIGAYANVNNPPAVEQPELTTTDEYNQVVATNFYDLENMKPQ